MRVMVEKVTVFPIKQRFTLARSFGLAEMSSQQLAYWQEQHYLDVRTERMLQQTMELRQQSAAWIGSRLLLASVAWGLVSLWNIEHLS